MGPEIKGCEGSLLSCYDQYHSTWPYFCLFAWNVFFSQMGSEINITPCCFKPRQSSCKPSDTEEDRTCKLCLVPECADSVDLNRIGLIMPESHVFISYLVSCLLVQNAHLIQEVNMILTSMISYSNNCFKVTQCMPALHIYFELISDIIYLCVVSALPCSTPSDAKSFGAHAYAIRV